MNGSPSRGTRRDFLKTSATATLGTSVLAGMVVPRRVHAAGSDTLKIGLIGMGGRGTGAAVDALSADPGAVLTAVGDAFADRAQGSLAALRAQPEVASRVQVADDHVFVGFDAYKQVIDSGVDVVIHATSPHFRPQHLAYAVAAGKHNFVEKPVAVDAPGVRSVIETCRQAEEKKLAIVSGLCYRYNPAVRAVIQKVHDGAVGEIIAIESAYNAGTLWHRGDNPQWSRMEYQMRNWLYYTWLSGDHIVEQAVHSLDKVAWLLGDTHPVRAWGMGGRQQRTGENFGHIYDHHSIVFEYDSGVRVYSTCRQQAGVSTLVDELVHGTGGKAEILRGRITAAEKWRYEGPNPSMYRVEHEELFKSIRAGQPINNGHYMANSTMYAIMGRMCTYTGQLLTWDQCLNSQEKLGPETYEWGDLPEPPVAIPGVTKFV